MNNDNETRPHRQGPGAGRRADRRGHHPGFDGGPGAADSGRGRGDRPRGAGRGRGRAQRGDVRAALLLLLAERPMHGYQLMQAIAERTSGAWSPSPGAVYPTLNLLEDEGLIATVSQGDRNLASLTEAGQAFLGTHGDELPDPFAEFAGRSAGGGSLRGAFEQLRDPVRQLAHSGDPHQVEAAQRLLGEARRSLYLILAGAPAAAPEPGEC